VPERRRGVRLGAAPASARELSRKAGAVPARDVRRVSWGGARLGGGSMARWCASARQLKVSLRRGSAGRAGLGELRRSEQEDGELGG
jgi:hypothetical protein